MAGPPPGSQTSNQLQKNGLGGRVRWGPGRQAGQPPGPHCPCRLLKVSMGTRRSGLRHPCSLSLGSGPHAPTRQAPRPVKGPDLEGKPGAVGWRPWGGQIGLQCGPSAGPGVPAQWPALGPPGGPRPGSAEPRTRGARHPSSAHKGPLRSLLSPARKAAQFPGRPWGGSGRGPGRRLLGAGCSPAHGAETRRKADVVKHRVQSRPEPHAHQGAGKLGAVPGPGSLLGIRGGQGLESGSPASKPGSVTPRSPSAQASMRSL